MADEKKQEDRWDFLVVFFWLTFFEDPKYLGDLFHIAFWKVDVIATEELFLMES